MALLTPSGSFRCDFGSKYSFFSTVRVPLPQFPLFSTSPPLTRFLPPPPPLNLFVPPPGYTLVVASLVADGLPISSSGLVSHCENSARPPPHPFEHPCIYPLLPIVPMFTPPTILIGNVIMPLRFYLLPPLPKFSFLFFGRLLSPIGFKFDLTVRLFDSPPIDESCATCVARLGNHSLCGGSCRPKFSSFLGHLFPPEHASTRSVLVCPRM